VTPNTLWPGCGTPAMYTRTKGKDTHDPNSVVKEQYGGMTVI